MSKELIVFPRGQLTELDRARLDEAGFVAIEVDEPASIHRVQSVSLSANVVNGDAIVMAALSAITGSGSTPECGAFVRELYRRLKQAEESA